MKLYYHSLSTCSQKLLIACYEKSISFTPEIVSLFDAAGREARPAIGRMLEEEAPYLAEVEAPMRA